MSGNYGKVYLVGSGPGDPELLTLKARRLIDSAEVIIYDQLPGKAILDSMPAGAEKIDVVSLKGCDPYVFGRGGEEAEVLVAEGIEFEVVPGITSAIAVPAYAGIPVTHRESTSMVTFITGHEDPTKPESWLDWETLAKFRGTIVILMGVKMLERNVDELMKHGKNPNTPVAVIEKGTRPDQRVTVGTLANIAELAKERKVKAPAITVVGDVVRLHAILGEQRTGTEL